jgi:hypothetical protein
VQGLRNSRGDMRGTDFSVDAPGCAMSHVSNGAARSREEIERDPRAADRAARERGTGTLTKSASSDEGETDKGATWSPLPPPHVSFS